MARVFISYRRADGQYAVGWIEERLRQLEVDADVQTAFRDSDLRYGDDFPDRLADEVHACDVLIAVIGPNWHGASDEGPARILDPADWVGREITSALNDPDKLVVPVLLAGVEPLRANDLLPEHRRFADLHAVRFDRREDLEGLAEQVGAHLSNVDEVRARLHGLDESLDVSGPRPPWTVLVAGLLAAIGGGTLAWRTVTDGEVGLSLWSSLVQWAFWTAAFVVGLWFGRRLLAGTIDINVRIVAQSAATAILLIVLTTTSFAADNDVVATLGEALIAVVLLSPWILALLGAGWSRTAATAVRPRALAVGLRRRSLGAATAVIGVALALSVAADAVVRANTDTSGFGSFKIVGFGIFLSLIMLAGIEYSHARIRYDSDLLRLETAELGKSSRKNVADVLVDGRGDLWPGIALGVAVPTIAAVTAGIVLVTK